MATDSDQTAKLVTALRSALKKNERLQERLDRAPEPIAVVGLGCRLPGGIDTPDALWGLLERGDEVTGPLPADRGWDLDALLGGDTDGPRSAMSRGAFLTDAAAFDPAFFGISPREAEAMEPQQRLLLEVAWESLERSGIPPTSLAGTDTGVYVGAIAQEYGPSLSEAPGDGFAVSGTTTSVASGRLSYTLGLTGPAITIDTACSSSLVAVHLAVKALRAGECSLALAGGATVMARPGILTEFTHLRGLAPDGRCKAFGAGADGAGFSEGAGMVVLERLSDARRSGHPVLAVIRGSAVNQDGASNGLTAPNGPSQERVIRAALADARLTPADVDLVEAHGTGTALGDPIEAQALISAYGRARTPDRPLWLGSLKSNLGHAQAAAGISGLIKLVLTLRHGVLPRTLHADEPTPHVDWSEGTVRLVDRARSWPATGAPRRAAVSSFGMSGTNAHLVVEQAPETEDAPAPGRDAGPILWPLSARGPAALAAQAARLRDRVAGDPAVDPVDVGWSLATSRTAFDHRAVVVGPDRDALTASLSALAENRPDPGVVTGRARADRRVVWVFPGQGGQWADMAVDLLTGSPVFAGIIADCERALAPHTDWSLTAVLRRDPGAPSLERVDVVQPVLWAVMVALAGMWRAHGVRPDAVVGHSQGEVAAACAAGLLSLEDAAAVVALRSRAVLELSGTGGMASVALPEERVRADLAGRDADLHIAVVNGPTSTVVAGEPEDVARLVKEYDEGGVRVRRIAVDYASHTPHVARLRERVHADLAGIVSRAGEIPFHSCLTGAPVGEGELDARYWYRNLAEPVRFHDTAKALVATGHDLFIEIGPHPLLGPALVETAEAEGVRDAAVVSTLRRDEGGPDRFRTALAEAFAHGVAPDWATVFGDGARLVDLPTYAFQRRRYWRDPATPTTAAPASVAGPGPETAEGTWTPPEGTTPAERARAVLDLVRVETAAILGHEGPDAVEPLRGFLDAGGTSLGAVRLRDRIIERTGLDLPVTVVLDRSTPAALADHLTGLLDDRDAPTPLLGELARLEGAVSAAETDGSVPDDVRRELSDRLRGLLRRVDAVPDPDGPDLDGVGDDQLLALIDQEFGIS
ncbi:type I polyketide synthase [Nocardiopsis lambiniae]|uniref:Acyltransferase domain-containing protein n=1 Tax=Nocardiopsis lambiniae TaxID=3075539 RepID=A0ABU2M4V0_9ACTN|nr:acyltransferase domain-containing protein [Nocardiopsis sp. DSM 44743]MDT0327637.1 acyltransferase domain-containing protein [Nocardiopsis sp. DSM 44743]